MTGRKKIILKLITCLFFLIQPILSFGQNTLEKQFKQIAKSISGNVGTCVMVIETGDIASLNGDRSFPMQSVYKFPIAMAVLSQVDKGNFSLDEIIHISKSEYIPEIGHSPIRDKFPNGANFTLRNLIRYSIEESDGTASDVLLRLLGGTKNAEQYIHELGITDIAIATTEMLQMTTDTVQYQNWVTPKAMTQLLKIFYQGENLSEQSRVLLLKYMSKSSPWFDRRIRGLLPPEIKVVHKTGSSGSVNGLTAATNDVGIIMLPNGKHLAISVFVSDSYATGKGRNLTIAKISKAAFDYWTK